MSQPTVYKWILIIGTAITLFTIVIAVVATLKTNALRKSLDKALLHNTQISSAIAVEHNKNITLSKAAHTIFVENERLLEVIDAMESEPEKIKYVVRTETKLIPVEPTKVFSDLPDQYQFKLDPGLIVADFYKEEEKYVFNTYDLGFKTTIVIDGEDTTAALLQVKSSADDIWYDVPTNLEVHHIKQKYPNIKPKLQIGFGATSSYLIPQPTATIPIIHLTSDIDILVPEITVGRTPNVGLLLGTYNIGNNLPLVEDVWVGAGVSTGLDLTPSFVGTITTNL